MFAEKFWQMNQCIINVLEKAILIVFEEIIQKGSILVWSIDKTPSLIYRHEMVNTNFINLDIKDYKGKVKIDILTNNEKTSRIININ